VLLAIRVGRETHEAGEGVGHMLGITEAALPGILLCPDKNVLVMLVRPPQFQ